MRITNNEKMKNLLESLNISYDDNISRLKLLRVTKKLTDLEYEKIKSLEIELRTERLKQAIHSEVKKINKEREVERLAIEVLKVISDVPLKFKKDDTLMLSSQNKLDYGIHSIFVGNLGFKKMYGGYVRVIGTILNSRYDRCIRLENIEDSVYRIDYNYLNDMLCNVRDNLTIDDYTSAKTEITRLESELKDISIKINNLKAAINE